MHFVHGLARVCAAATVGAAILAPQAASPQALPSRAQIQQPGAQVLRETVPQRPSAERGPLVAGRLPQAPAYAEGVALERIEVQGATLYDAELLSHYADIEAGTALTPESVAEAAGRVQTFYRSEGYIFTQVVPIPSDAPGVLRLRVVEARIDLASVVESAGAVGPSVELARAVVARLQGLANPTLADLERTMLILNDIPGYTRAIAVPRPGPGGPGSIEIVVNVERDPFEGLIFADNRQAPAYGPGSGGVLASWNSFGPGGDTLTFTGVNSFAEQIKDLQERSVLQLEYSRFLGSDGLRAGLRGLYTHSAPGEELAPLNLEGDEWDGELWLDYPLVRTRPLSIWLAGGLTVNERKLDAGVGAPLSDDSTRGVYLEARTLSRDDAYYSQGLIQVRQGLSVLGGSQAGDINLSRSDGDPEAFVIYAEIEHEQYLNDLFSLFGRVASQWTDDPLLAGDEFVIGGGGFGRGFDPSESSGDVGMGASVELRLRQEHEVYGIPVISTVYGFADYGRVVNLGAGRPAHDELVSAGLGVRAAIGERYAAGIEMAKPFGELKRTNDDHPRFFLFAQMRF